MEPGQALAIALVILTGGAWALLIDAFLVLPVVSERVTFTAKAAFLDVL